jgi:hypothetical protein
MASIYGYDLPCPVKFTVNDLCWVNFWRSTAALSTGSSLSKVKRNRKKSVVGIRVSFMLSWLRMLVAELAE